MGDQALALCIKGSTVPQLLTILHVQDLVKEGELHYLPAAEAYFDDRDHLEYIR